MHSRRQVKWLIYLYGGEIVEAIVLDDVLSHIQANRMVGYKLDDPAGKHRNLIRDLDYLTQEGYLSAYSDNHYAITKKGALKLSSGGFTGDAKKSKNALFAFRISLVAITISCISFIVSLFRY